MKTKHLRTVLDCTSSKIDHNISSRVFFHVKRQSAAATDGIKHENVLMLSITILILYVYIKMSQMSAVLIRGAGNLMIKRERVTEFLFESVF